MVPDAGSATEAAWLGAVTAALLVAAGLAAGSPAPVHAAVAVLGAIFLARQDVRLLLAPAYGGGLLMLEDLAIQTIELRAVDRISVRSIGVRLAARLTAVAVGAFAAAVAALAVTVAPGRSVAITAVGAIAAVAAFAAIVRSARSRYRTTVFDELPSSDPPETEGSRSILSVER